MSKDRDGLPLLLIEEPEAHLHPQRQLQLMEFLQSATGSSGDGGPVQVILTTHSPNLASKIPLSNLVVMSGKRPFSLREGSTELASSDYKFLERFLDVTKANLFFARAVMVVEGDAEELLLPAIASILGRDLTKAGVSVVNVRGTGLRRYSRIFQRPSGDGLGVRVAAISDLDVMPDAAPAILGLVVDDSDERWTSSTRRWRARKDYPEDSLEARRAALALNDGQGVRTFVADHWTFEYALAIAGLAKLVHRAAMYAKYDEQLNDGSKSRDDVTKLSVENYEALVAAADSDQERVAIEIYKLFHSRQASKAIAAQYLAQILEQLNAKNQDFGKKLRTLLPQYLVQAIDYVTSTDDPGDLVVS